MDPLLGTGLFILGAVVWAVCVYYAYQKAPGLGRRRGVWTALAVIFGPIALMILYVLPKKPALAGYGQDRTDPHAARYERPRKK